MLDTRILQPVSYPCWPTASLLSLQHQTTLSLSICKAEYTTLKRSHLPIFLAQRFGTQHITHDSSLRKSASYQALPKPAISHLHKKPRASSAWFSYTRDISPINPQIWESGESTSMYNIIKRRRDCILRSDCNSSLGHIFIFYLYYATQSAHRYL